VDDPSGDPAPTENLDPDANSCCILCAAQNCPDQVADCYATGPENICGVKNGEIQLIQDCMLENEGLPGFGDDSDFIGCVAEAANGASGPLCGLGTISGTTNDFAVCLHGDESGVGGCFEECFTDFVDDACVYRD
jgi:hypothetical protein